MLKLATGLLSWLAAAGPSVAAAQSITCRFNFEQSITRADVKEPTARTGPLAPPEVYTLTFDAAGNAGRYTKETRDFGTAVGDVIVLRVANRLSFYETNVFGDNLFFLTVFTGERLEDGHHPAVMSSHAWWPGTKNMAGEEAFLPTQAFGSCR
jgi:hypothetical protein